MKINSKFQEIMSSRLCVWLLSAQGMYRLQKWRRPLFLSPNWESCVDCTGRRLSSIFKYSLVLHESYFEVMFTFPDRIWFSGRHIWVLSAYFWLMFENVYIIQCGRLELMTRNMINFLNQTGYQEVVCHHFPFVALWKKANKEHPVWYPLLFQVSPPSH